MDSVLRPRDIQARIRSGESPEAVAAAAQTSVDRIMGYATPVLAERAYVAEQALKASVRRRAGEGTVGNLGQAVEQRLATRDLDPEQVSWDAWRRDDGRWTLVADFPADDGETRAEFVYDAAGRYVVAQDDDARWLVGERTSTAPATEPAEPTHPADPEPAAASHSDQLPLGDDAIELVTGARAAAPERPAEDDWMITQATERTAPPTPQPRGTVEEPAETLFDAPLPEESSPAAEQVVEPQQAEEPPPAEKTPAKPKKSSKSRRASVPSWDEIMFGSGKGE
jgi:hypothetical protein